MKKELIMLGSMIAMSGALSSCCCERGGAAAYRQNRQNVYATAPRVTNYKDGGTVRGTPGYIQPTSAEGITLTAPVEQPVYQQPARQSSCYQVQPEMNVQPDQYNGQMIVPSPGLIEAHMNYVNSGVPYNANGDNVFYRNWNRRWNWNWNRRSGCPAGSSGCGHWPTWHWGNCR